MKESSATELPIGSAAGLGRSSWAGIGAALATVTIWAGWIIATRFAGAHAIDPITIGLLRYGPPALVLAPIWWRCGLLPRCCPWWVTAIMVVGSGAPFLLLAASGMRFTPAAQVGALLPGTMPLWAALLGRLLGQGGFTTGQRLGYALIGLGAGAMLLASGVASASAAGSMVGPIWLGPIWLGPIWLGRGLLLLAAASWAAYSHAFKRSGLMPLQGAAVVAAWSLIIHLVLAGCFGQQLGELSLAVLMTQLTVQGLLSGLIAIFSYGFAVATLGPTRAAAFSALAPALASLGGAVLLGEMPRAIDIAAVVWVTFGVALANKMPAARRSLG